MLRIDVGAALHQIANGRGIAGLGGGQKRRSEDASRTSPRAPWAISNCTVAKAPSVDEAISKGVRPIFDWAFTSAPCSTRKRAFFRLAGGHHERGDTQRVGHIHIGALGDQHLNGVRAPYLGGI